MWNIVPCAFFSSRCHDIVMQSTRYQNCSDYTLFSNYSWSDNDRITFFTNGAWLEAQGIFGVVDDLSTLYLIKENGDLLARRTCDQLKLSSCIIDLVVQDGSSLLRWLSVVFS